MEFEAAVDFSFVRVLPDGNWCPKVAQSASPSVTAAMPTPNPNAILLLDPVWSAVWSEGSSTSLASADELDRCGRDTWRPIVPDLFSVPNSNPIHSATRRALCGRCAGSLARQAITMADTAAGIAF